MSLIRPSDLTTTSYGESKLYTRKSSSENSGVSTQILSADNHKFKYGTESNCRGSYDQQQQYFSVSPTEEYSASRIEFISPSDSGSLEPLFRPQDAVSYQLIGGSGSVSSGNSFDSSFVSSHPNGYQPGSASDYFDGLSPDNGMIDCDGDDIRCKLQELERELLNEDDAFSVDENMDIDCEWADSIKNLVLPNSPKESSSDSNLSSISSSNLSSNRDSHVMNPVSSAPSTPNQKARQMLFDCASLISESNMEEAKSIINKLRQTVSIQGDPLQRLAAYMVEGLAARVATSGRGLYKALKCKEPPTTDRLSAMQILFEVCPCFKFGFMAANGAIAELFKNEQGVHIVDFDINQGSQYITLIQALASRTSKPPHIRITGVDDPETVQRTVGGLKVIGQRLEKLAEAVGVPFEFHAVAVKTEEVTPSMLGCRPSEALVVNFAFQLHHMPDESVSTVNQRDQLLRMVKSLKPKLVTVVEQDVNTNTAPFFPRFVEAYNYYSAVFESLDATMPRDSPDRMNVERHCLARDIINIVACEGEDRIERYEVAGKWRARMTMAGFKPYPLSTYVNGTIRTLLKQYCDRYKVKEEGGGLQFGWEDKILIVASAWC